MASAILRFGNLTRVVNTFKCISYRQLPHLLQRQIHLQTLNYDAMKLLMPALSPTMSEGTIVKWLKKEGDVVGPGDVLCDIQTDKAVVSMENEEDGILAKILVPDNTKDVKIGTLIAVMVEEGDDWQNVEIPAHTAPDTGPPAPPTPPPSTPSPVATPAAAATTAASASVSSKDLHAAGVGPSVRKLAEEYGVSPAQVTGTGPHDRVTKGDVLNYIKSKNLAKRELMATPAPGPAAATPSSAPPPQALPPLEGEPFTDIPNTSMRKTIAKRLTESKTTIPHSYASMDMNIGPVSRLRKQLADEGVKVSINDFIIKAAGIALQRVPRVNSIWQNDGAQLLSSVDISVAVATDNGLITPIVQNASALGVDEISSTVRDLAGRAREGKLKLHEFQGGSFSISNLGMFGISEFSAVINPPQTAIMAVGTSRVTLGDDGRPQTRMTVTLSYDSRVLDETEASQFLEVYSEVMENPSFMITGSKLSGKVRASF
ncbi:pyruvate dehydrogenase protein X component-like [Haliotis rufescens]|uniref:pyruvate dehydrogenase protein X component-like n=1 Tax=Haliotis rufescens TaxID=6454 RepID=UPI00201E95C2|nr:pyruvate dehydrogenase protein X component-like [Haliotis rufescens]